jgi:uncharacterized protein YcnI
MIRFGVFLAAVGGALIVAASASAHAEMSPAVALTKHGQVFALAVPTEKASSTTKVELTLPDGFSIDSFAPSPGWTRTATKSNVTWSGGSVPQDEDAFFQFLASADSAKTYTFKVRQTYSDGSVVDWSGPESSDTPAAQVEFKSSLGGGGGSSTLAIVALVVGVVALVVAFIALFTGGGSGRRTLA